MAPQPVRSGTLSFTIESRIIRELGERLVKQPEIAVLELVKNAYDAEATQCEIKVNAKEIVVHDTGSGMTFDSFRDGWMRIGTSSKSADSLSPKFKRPITGEKGIGRFAVRFLGSHLKLESIANDPKHGKTRLEASFDWPVFDKAEDIGKVSVPYKVTLATDADPLGTILTISELSQEVGRLDLKELRTSSLGIVTPLQSLMSPTFGKGRRKSGDEEDPGFRLEIHQGDGEGEDVADRILSNFVLRAVVRIKDQQASVDIYRRSDKEPKLSLKDRLKNNIGELYADIRFFPGRSGTFTGLGVDGRRAKTWVKENCGVSVFDRGFRMYPYGTIGNDWLSLATDSARNERHPQSTLARKYLPMDEQTRRSTELNYMLRLPHPEQLVGIVQVMGARGASQSDQTSRLVAAADREGFLENEAYHEFQDLIRGAVEAIAYSDRELQLEQQKQEQKVLLRELQRETREAIKEIEDNPHIQRSVKLSLVRSLTNTQQSAVQVSEYARERESALEVMSLMGVVAGFMTHEFGVAVNDLERAHDLLVKASSRNKQFTEEANRLAERIASLKEFITYSQGYIHGAGSTPSKRYAAKPRIQQVVRVFGKYAEERGIKITVEVEGDVMAPLVPPSLYNGISLNLYTNALKAITASTSVKNKEISFRAWNDRNQHFLEVSDTGIGVPEALRSRIFDPLFSTTTSNRDPLGSGMGLGLSLVRRSLQAFGGRIDVTDPPPGFNTTFRVRLPIQ